MYHIFFMLVFVEETGCFPCLALVDDSAVKMRLSVPL